MNLRQEEPGDRRAIRDVVIAAFGRRDEAELVDRLRADGDAVLSLVAVEDRRLVGHLLLSRMIAPFRALALAPVAVRPDRQRCGIGSRLVRTGLARAAKDGWQGVVVLGDPGYYRRFGFDPDAAAPFRSPFAGPFLMVAALDGPLPATDGEITHAPAFRALA